MTRERISRILELREILLPFETGFNLVSAANPFISVQTLKGTQQSAYLNFG